MNAPAPRGTVRNGTAIMTAAISIVLGLIGGGAGSYGLTKAGVLRPYPYTSIDADREIGKVRTDTDKNISKLRADFQREMDYMRDAIRGIQLADAGLHEQVVILEKRVLTLPPVEFQDRMRRLEFFLAKQFKEFEP